MTIARKNLIDPLHSGFYHCMSRCVRRAFLCGEDHFTKSSFDHRKIWLEQRIWKLSGLFAVDIFSYAIMSNHFHLVLYRDPARASKWTDREIVRRWLAIFPPKNENYADVFNLLLRDTSQINSFRTRLASISWLMRCIKEPLARTANREDKCTGRFWEGRFRSQALLDRAAILSCMAYVDLNPLRAGICTNLADAKHTSICSRLRQSAFNPTLLQKPMRAIGSDRAAPEFFSIIQADYHELLNWSRRQWAGNHAHSKNSPPPLLLQGLPHTEVRWLEQMEHFERDWRRAAGSMERLRELARRLGQRCMHGISTAQTIYHPPVECVI